VTRAQVEFTRTLLFAGTVSNFVPVTVTLAPVAAPPGVKPVMVGAVPPTAKVATLVFVVLPTLTEIVPVVAPAGTVVTICVVVDEVTVAVVPLNFTVLSDGVGLKAVP
jgi:hypothetical protein